MAVMRSIASGHACVMTLLRGVVEKVGNLKFMAVASLRPSGQVWAVGVPMMLQILYISSACRSKGMRDVIKVVDLG